MATRQVVTFISDLSGKLADPGTAKVRFALDGADYEIDLTAGEQIEFREILKPFVDAARRRRPAGQTVAAETTVSNQEIRAWAAENGFEVPQRGRIPAPVRDAFGAAHSQMAVARIERLLQPVRAPQPQ